MKLAAFSTVLLIALAIVSSSPHAETKQVGSTGITTADGLGIPNGTSSGKDYLPWLKATDDADYGYTKEKPVEIGGYLEGMGNTWPSQYLSSLLGPNGEATSFERVKSCCRFAVTNPKILADGVKVGLLDVFKVTVEGKPPVLIYVTLYSEGIISAPKGFTTRGKQL